MDTWARELQALDRRLRERLGPSKLGNKPARRQVLSQIGTFESLHRMLPSSINLLLDGRPMVGVDGSINSYGGDYPHYVALLRAAAVPTRGEPIIERHIHAPVADPAPRANGIQEDALFRRQELTRLEAEVASQAMQRLKPTLILMDGPLVRFDKEARNSFNILAKQALERDILLVGVIENLESRVIAQHLDGALPPGWEGLYDRELLWDLLQYDGGGRSGEVLKLKAPIVAGDGDQSGGFGIRRWFMRTSREPGVIGLDFLEEQVIQDKVSWVPQYLFTLTPEDGRGIPVWMDMVDRQVRITEAELTTYINHYLSAEIRQKLLLEKRQMRPGY